MLNETFSLIFKNSVYIEYCTCFSKDVAVYVFSHYLVKPKRAIRVDGTKHDVARDSSGLYFWPQTGSVHVKY